MEKTSRYELGSRFAEICVGEYEHTLEYIGDVEPEKDKVKTSKEGKTTSVGNDKKFEVDSREEMINKGQLTTAEAQEIVDENWDVGGMEEEYEVSGGEDNSAVLLGVIAIGALVMTGFGGAMAAI